MEPLHDTLGRPLETLRVSITDRCNFRCVYCMPKEVFGRDYAFLDRRELLSFEEIARVCQPGVRRARASRTVRLTRAASRSSAATSRSSYRYCSAAIRRSRRAGPNDEQRTPAAEGAGARRRGPLPRHAVSLDSVDDAQFRALNDVDFPVDRVLEGIDAAAAAGLPVKVNAVIKRGVNDDGIVALAERFRGTGHVLRFIEYMDVGHTNGWRLDDVVPAAEIVQRIGAAWPLEPVAAALPTRPRAGGATRTAPARSASSPP